MNALRIDIKPEIWRIFLALSQYFLNLGKFTVFKEMRQKPLHSKENEHVVAVQSLFCLFNLTHKFEISSYLLL